MLLVSDVHGAFDALRRVADSGETLLVLGDLINLLDYRTGDGIIADVLGPEFSAEVSTLRGAADYPAMRAAWQRAVGDSWEEVRHGIERGVREQYRLTTAALEGAAGYVTFGNVDRPDALAEAVPAGMAFVDGDAVDVDGVMVGFVGGGTATPVGAAGEVGDDEMRTKLDLMGEVEVLCSHLPPAIDPLRRDVITGRLERGSRPILEYIEDVQPAFHFFGDVHQPQAERWRVGRTVCRNVGYFRATGRPVRFDP